MVNQQQVVSADLAGLDGDEALAFAGSLTPVGSRSTASSHASPLSSVVPLTAVSVDLSRQQYFDIPAAPRCTRQSKAS